MKHAEGRVESKDTEIIVTDRGKPVVKISKYYEAPPTQELFAEFRGKIKYLEDPTTSTTEEWREV